MKGSASFKTGVKFALILMTGFVLAGIAADKPAGIAPQEAVTLAYQFPAGKTLSYKESSTQNQNMDIMGQTMTTVSASSLEFTLNLKGMKGQDFELSAVIDAGMTNADTPQGSVSTDMSPVIGKGFDMIISRLGREIDVTGATALKVDSPNGGQRDISSTFQPFFPDLPDKAVKVGDTWPSEDMVVQKEGSGETRMKLANQNTLDGFETVDGYECARVKVVAKGTLEGNLEQQGMSMTVGMKLDSQGTWYFAIKEGIYVKSEYKGTLNGTIEVGAPANMSIAMTGETTGQTNLIKK
jgi:hypothetical protein